MSKEQHSTKPSSQISPGQVLREAREQAKLSLQDVSDETRITVSRLAALEADDYDKAGMSAAFLVGYIRSYAKLLNVPSQPLVDAVDDYVVTSMSAADAEAFEVAKRQSASVQSPPLNLGRWIGLAIIVLLAWGLAHLFFSESSQPTRSSALKPVAEMRDEESEAFGAEEQASVGAEIKINRIPVAERDKTVEQEQLEEIVAIEEAAGADPSLSDTSSDSVSTVASPIQTASDNSASEAAQTVATLEEPVDSDAENVEVASSDSPPIIADEDLDTLRIAFTEECWLEVRDAQGEVVAMRLAKPGAIVNLKGVAPFDVKLGNVLAADLQVNGRRVELTPRPGKKTLRIQVGP